MHRFTLGVVLAALVSLSIQSGPVPSQTSCFVCPPTDLAGRALIAHSRSSSELFCRYESTPNDFFCHYFIDTGLVKQDHDNGFCPPVASVGTCTAGKTKRSAIPRSPRAPEPGARSVSDTMKTRAQLKRSRPASD